MTFLEKRAVLKGAPTTEKHVHEFYENIRTADRFSWQFRIAMTFAEFPRHQCAWITLTYRKEPASWITARTHINQWLKSVKDYCRRVLVPEHEQYVRERIEAQPLLTDLPPGLQKNPAETIRYIIVEEQGSENGRKHFHALVWMPYKLPIRQWEDPLIKWKHGFQKIKRQRADDDIKRSIYIAKYAMKSNGRIKCNVNFGLMTTTILMSISSFRLLVMVHPSLAQKLLRRLSLKPNYPTLKLMTSLTSSGRLSTILPSVPPPSVLGQNRTGARSGSKAAADGSVAAIKRMGTEVYRPVPRTAVKEAVEDIRTFAAWSCSQEGFPDLNKTLPGLALFGRPLPITLSARLEPHKNTAVWFAKSNYPRCARNRAKRTAIQV